MRPSIKIEGGQVFYTYSIEKCPQVTGPDITFILREWKATVHDPDVTETGVKREVKITPKTIVNVTLKIAAKNIMPEPMAERLIDQADPVTMLPGEMRLLDWNGKPELIVSSNAPPMRYPPPRSTRVQDFSAVNKSVTPGAEVKKPTHKCDECKDTGEYDCPFKGKVPCSQGCPKPGHAHIQDDGVYLKVPTAGGGTVKVDPNHFDYDVVKGGTCKEKFGNLGSQYGNHEFMVFDDVVPDDHVVDEAAVLKWFQGDFRKEVQEEYDREG